MGSQNCVKVNKEMSKPSRRLGQLFKCPPKSTHHAYVLRCCKEPLSVDSIASAEKIFKNFKKKLRNPVGKALKISAGCMLFAKLRL